MESELWESIYETLLGSKDSITEETMEMLHANLDAFYKQEVTKEVKPYPKKNTQYPR